LPTIDEIEAELSAIPAQKIKRVKWKTDYRIRSNNEESKYKR
jgi:hypothetical protein